MKSKPTIISHDQDQGVIVVRFTNKPRDEKDHEGALAFVFYQVALHVGLVELSDSITWQKPGGCRAVCFLANHQRAAVIEILQWAEIDEPPDRLDGDYDWQEAGNEPILGRSLIYEARIRWAEE